MPLQNTVFPGLDLRKFCCQVVLPLVLTGRGVFCLCSLMSWVEKAQPNTPLVQQKFTYLLLCLLDALSQNFPVSSMRTARIYVKIKHPFRNSEWLHWLCHMRYGSPEGFGRSGDERALSPREWLMLKAHFEKICSSSFPSLLWVPQSGSCTPRSIGNGASCLSPKSSWSVEVLHSSLGIDQTQLWGAQIQLSSSSPAIKVSS